MGEVVDNRKVEPYFVHYVCGVDGCRHHQKADPSRGMLLSSPPKYPHRCESGHEMNLSVCYPDLRYRYAPGVV